MHENEQLFPVLFALAAVVATRRRDNPWSDPRTHTEMILINRSNGAINYILGRCLCIVNGPVTCCLLSLFFSSRCVPDDKRSPTNYSITFGLSCYQRGDLAVFHPDLSPGSGPAFTCFIGITGFKQTSTIEDLIVQYSP